ncbi:MAG: general secretion pathway protein GspK [Desulfobacteraceae bacterium]
MSRRITTEHGIALVLILWVLALLSVIVGEFCYAMRTEVNITRNFKAQTEAYYIALAGVNMAIRELIRDQIMPRESTPREGQADETAKKAEKAESETEEQRDRVRINTDLPPVSFEAGAFRVRVDNESGKININGANENLLKMMVEAFDLEEQQRDIIVDSILDWRDENDLRRLNGAEDDYYQSLPEPYECKDGDFDSVEELLLVRGVTPEIYNGGLKDMVSVLKPPKGNEKIVAGFKQFRVDFRRININAAPGAVLLALPGMTENLVTQVMEYRKEADFKKLSEFCSIVGQDVCKAVSPYITLEMGPFYKITSEGSVNNRRIRQTLNVVVEVSRNSKRGYRVVQWRDQFNPGVSYASNPTE